jgi:hypothetical protein
MSLEQVVNLYKELLQETSESLKNDLKNAGSQERFVEIADEAGYEFTVDELNSFLASLKKSNITFSSIESWSEISDEITDQDSEDKNFIVLGRSNDNNDTCIGGKNCEHERSIIRNFEFSAKLKIEVSVSQDNLIEGQDLDLFFKTPTIKF